MYAQGRGVDKDYKEAAKWFRMAAQQGHPQAHSSLVLALKTDLDAIRKLTDSDKPPEREQARTRLTGWLEDNDFIPVRDPERLKTIPDNERKVWQSFWADVRALLEMLNAPKK
jgi:TPR repeat protein